MAVLTVVITNVDDEDYDGNPITVREAVAEIDGAANHETFFYEDTKTDTEIETDVRAKLEAKGYVFS